MTIARRALVLALLAASGPAWAQADAAHAAPGSEGASAGEAPPSDQAWGDEWFDEQAKKAAAEEERKILESAGARGAPARKAAPPAPARPAAPGPTGPMTGLPPPSAPAPAPASAPEIPGAVESTSHPIQPPTHHFSDLTDLWNLRRVALQRNEIGKADAYTAQVRDALADLDVPEVHAFAASTARESQRLADHPADALKRAELAVTLGPTLPAAHVQLARARYAVDPLDVRGWGAAAYQALRTSLAQPRHVRPLLIDVVAALCAGLLAAGAVVLALAFARHVRPFLHDVHHLFPRGASPAQSGALTLLLLALPFLFWTGPLAPAAALGLAAWLYMALAERVAVATFVALLGLVPIVAGAVAERAAWDGTPAATLHSLERAGDFSRLPELEAWVKHEDAPPQAVFALARAHKREGDLERARELYERVLRSRASWPAALVNLGNVRFLQGDVGAAERLYKDAIAAQPTLAAAYFDLSRLHYRRLDLSMGQDTRARALELDRNLVEQYAAGEEPRPRANRLLVDVPLSDSEMSVLAVQPAEGQRVSAQLAAALVGPVPLALVPVAPLAALALFALLHALRRRLQPSPSCTRCGRPVCVRCDPDTRGGELCGQCLNLFARKVAVDPLARVQKEIAVRRHQSRRNAVLRLSSFLLASQVLSGRTWRGLLLLTVTFVLLALALQGPGLVRAPFGGVPPPWKLAVIVPVLAALYAWSVRDGLNLEED
jgi:tetratricopeptide (TPR) repeat protein